MLARKYDDNYDYSYDYLPHYPVPDDSAAKLRAEWQAWEREAERRELNYRVLRNYLFKVVATAFTCYLLCVGLSIYQKQQDEKLGELYKLEQTMEQDARLLTLEIGKLKSPERIKEMAQNELGMKLANSNIYVHALPGKIKGQTAVALAPR